MTVDACDNPCKGDDAAAIRLYLTRHLETRGDESSVTEYQTTCLCEDGVHVSVESPVALRVNDGFGFDFRDPKVETGMSGEAINPERAYMVTATNLPVAEFDTDAVPSGGAWHQRTGYRRLVYVRSARHARHRQAQYGYGACHGALLREETAQAQRDVAV